MPLYRQHAEMTKSGSLKVKERFSCVEMKAVKLSFKDIFYFRISKKLPSFCTKTVDRQAAVGKLLFCHVKFNIGHGTEKFRRLFQSASTRHTSRAAVWHWRAQRSSQKVLWRINKKLISWPDRRTLRRHSSYRYGCETTTTILNFLYLYL